MQSLLEIADSYRAEEFRSGRQVSRLSMLDVSTHTIAAAENEFFVLKREVQL